MSYRLDKKQAELFARAIMPELYRRQYIFDSYRGIAYRNRNAAGKEKDYLIGSQLYERHEITGDDV